MGLTSKITFTDIEAYDLANVGTPVTGEIISIAGASPYNASLPLDRVPKQSSPSDITISTGKNGTGTVLTEITSGEVTANQYRVRYGMSRIDFHSSRAGQSLWINYKWVGTHITVERLNNYQSVLSDVQDDLLGGNSGEVPYSKGGTGVHWGPPQVPKTRAVSGEAPITTPLGHTLSSDIRLRFNIGGLTEDTNPANNDDVILQKAGGGAFRRMSVATARGRQTFGYLTDVSGEVSANPADGDLLEYDASVSQWRKLATGASGEALYRGARGYFWKHPPTFEGGISGETGRVGISSNDTTFGYVEEKVTGTAGQIAFTVNNEGGNETYQAGFAANALVHTLGSELHTDVSGEVTAAAADGDLLYYSSAIGKYRKLATGGSGEVLVRTGSGYIWGNILGGAVAYESPSNVLNFKFKNKVAMQFVATSGEIKVYINGAPIDELYS